MRAVLLLVFPASALTGCGGPVLQDLPPGERAPLCRQLAAAPTGTYGCSPDQLAGYAEGDGKRFEATLDFAREGQVLRYTGLREARTDVTAPTSRAPDCVVDELKAWRLEGLKTRFTLPVVLTYVAGPTDFRESALEGPACHVRITLESQ
ncbi:MAG: hypothetical protein R3F60_15025 [bacterium]